MDKEDRLPSEVKMKRLNRLLSILFEETRYLDDEDRDLPLRWHMMHMYSASQLIKILAIKRQLEPELAGMIAALHDYGLVKTKRKANHALIAKSYVNDIIDLYNQSYSKGLMLIDDKEREIIIRSVVDHSKKNEVSNDPYVELMKDVDSFDRYLHGIKTDGDHAKRATQVLYEMGMADYLEGEKSTKHRV